MTEHPSRRPPDPTSASPSPNDLEPSIAPAPTSAPRAVGEVVPGDPPVPLTLWYLPAAAAGDVVSGALARRLRTNYAHPQDPVLDLTAVPSTAPPAESRIALLITTWPQDQTTINEHMIACAAFLRPGGCAVVVVTSTDIPEQLGHIVGAAREAGLTYLQHLVVAHRGTGPGPVAVTRKSARSRPLGHLRVHTDVLVLARPRAADV